MSKRTSTKDVFDQIAEHDDPVEAPDDTAESEQTAEATPDDNGHRPARRRRRIVTVGVVVVAVAALALSAFLGWRVKQNDDTTAAGRAALDAARNYAVVLTTLDSKDVDKNFTQVLDGATGEFKNEYSQGSAQLRQILIDNNATGKGLVVDAAVKSATKTKVEVLLFVDQSVTNTLNPSPRIDRNRVRMTMQLVEGRWLASKVEIV